MGSEFHGMPPKSKTMSCKTYFGKTYQELFDRTLERLEALENLGYRVVFIWEGQWNILKKQLKLKKKSKK